MCLLRREAEYLHFTTENSGLIAVLEVCLERLVPLGGDNAPTQLATLNECSYEERLW